ncbi:MAG: hypothetical protein J7K40_13560 [candidate division Zixibacteria bacterium]|nr:hypothetical protein [candidate division Zixibacteria bacterium]
MTWITRNQRPKQHTLWLRLLLIVLIIIAVGLVLARFYPAAFEIFNSSEKFCNGGNINNTDEIETFYLNILTELNLDQNEIHHQPLNFNSQTRDYPCYSILWPKELPFVWFTSELAKACRRNSSIIYEAIEINKDGNLAAWLISPSLNDTISELVLISSFKAQTRVSSISFIFKDFVELKQKKALELVWQNIAFGFILYPDQAPGKKLNRALKSSSGQCILELPSAREDWEIVLNSHRLLKNIKDKELNMENILAIFKSYPALDAFYLQADTNYNRELVRMIIDATEKLHLTYIYQNNNPNYIDSLAYAKGLKIKRLINTIDCSYIASDEFRMLVIAHTNEFTELNKGTYLISSNPDNVDILISLFPLFQKMNIKIVPPLRHTESVEKL